MGIRSTEPKAGSSNLSGRTPQQSRKLVKRLRAATRSTVALFGAEFRRALAALGVFVVLVACGGESADYPRDPSLERRQGALSSWNTPDYSGAQVTITEPLKTAAGMWRPEDANSLGGPSGKYVTAARLLGQYDNVAAGMVTTVNNTVRTQVPVVDWNGNRTVVSGCTINPVHYYAFNIRQGGFSYAGRTLQVVVTVTDWSAATPCGSTLTISRPGGGVPPTFDTLMCTVTKEPANPVGKFLPFNIWNCAAQKWSGPSIQPTQGADTALYNLVSSDFSHYLITSALPSDGTVALTWQAAQ